MKKSFIIILVSYAMVVILACFVASYDKISITGAAKETDLIVKGAYNPADKSFTSTGVIAIKNDGYKVKPPTVNIGKIEAGNDVSIFFNLKFMH